MTKYIVITGGSVSGLGKGTLASSVGLVLKSAGYRVTAIKIDPYLNVDAGTIAPSEHGEVFVLADGHEGDLDLGNYERALDICLTRDHNMTTGKIYRKIIQAERNGDYLGATVQMVPHVTDMIQHWLARVGQVCVDGPADDLAMQDPLPTGGEKPDICLIEVGGTVGDIESSVYLEALQQFFSRQAREEDSCLCHIVFIPQFGNEQKTKCAQHSFKALREAGLAGDFILGRAEDMLEPATKRKLSIFGGIKDTHVIGLPNVSSNYKVPELLIEQNFHHLLCDRLKLPYVNPQAVPFPGGLSPIDAWRRISERLDRIKQTPVVKIAFVAKYIGSNDTYLSVVKAVEHSATESEINAQLEWIEAELLLHEVDSCEIADCPCQAAWAKVKECQGVLVPGGFGHRGVQGMVRAIRYARTRQVPYFGICLGMQLACIEAAQSFLNMPLADSEEFGAEGENRVIVFMPETIHQVMGGTMRLGNRTTRIEARDSLLSKIYDGQEAIVERHRHRYEFNVDFYDRLSEHGLRFVGKDTSGQRLEVLELPQETHPFFLGVQYHPELTSKPAKPNPCFLAFVLACAGQLGARFAKYHNKLQPGAAFFNPQ